MKDVARAPTRRSNGPTERDALRTRWRCALPGNMVSYVVNGTVVHSVARKAVTTDGVVGFRVNHQLDVAVDGFELQRS